MAFKVTDKIRQETRTVVSRIMQGERAGHRIKLPVYLGGSPKLGHHRDNRVESHAPNDPKPYKEEDFC